jgi:DNA-binding NtrC family response regulator
MAMDPHEKIVALLLQDREDSPGPLKRALESRSVHIVTAKTCLEASGWLSGPNIPHLVFTPVDLADGTWSDVLHLAARAPQPINVIVVSPLTDIGLYISVVERGAFDFIIQSFAPFELVHIVRCAVDNVVSRRKAGVTGCPPREGERELRSPSADLVKET